MMTRGVVARPRLFERLAAPGRAAVISAPPGSGKTVLLRSWITQAGLDDSAAWVAVERGERDPRRFWLSVLAALRETAPGAVLVRAVTPAPDLDGWVLAEKLLNDLASLNEPLWLVVDDVHDLGEDTLRQLELLIMRAPDQLRFVLATRHDVRLGLHRLRLAGELTEIRAPDLRFTTDEAAELLQAAEISLPGLESLVERTEGWAAGLRLAALSLAGHPDPERLAAEFSGSERTVAEYLLAEVLDRQPGHTRQLLLRTSILDRVNGELADLLTGASGGERLLHELEHANAFVVSVDAGRSWFRYHHLFADLLRLELRRTAPDAIAALHQAAARWLAANGYPAEAVRHAQAAPDWPLATSLLAEHWPGLHLDGHDGAIHELLAAFPPGTRAADAQLAAVAAADELAYGSLEAAGQSLDLAERVMASVPDDRRGQVRVLLGITRLLLARQRADLPAVSDESRRLQSAAADPDTAPDPGRAGLGEQLRALALISLGSTEYWAARFDEAERHLEHGVTLARQIRRPFLEFTGLAYQAAATIFRSFSLAAERGMRAAELAERHGWTGEPAAGIACMAVATVLTLRGQLGEAEPWIQRAERTVRVETEPALALVIRYTRGMLELGRGQAAAALAAFRSADPLAARLTAPHYLIPRTRALLVLALVRLGEIERAGQVIAELAETERDRGESRIAAAVLRLAQHDPHAAIAELAPIVTDSTPVTGRGRLAEALLLEAIARDTLDDPGSAGKALELALDIAEPEGVLFWFLLYPAPALLERHARQRTAHPGLIAEILGRLAGQAPVTPAGRQPLLDAPLLEALSDSEVRVLRYLPTNLQVPQIASELYVSHNTIRTHMKHLYAKLGTHTRADTVARARTLGLLAPSPRLLSPGPPGGQPRRRSSAG